MGNTIILEVCKLQIQHFFNHTKPRKTVKWSTPTSTTLSKHKIYKIICQMDEPTKKKITHIQKYKFTHI